MSGFPVISVLQVARRWGGGEWYCGRVSERFREWSVCVSCPRSPFYARSGRKPVFGCSCDMFLSFGQRGVKNMDYLSCIIPKNSCVVVSTWTKRYKAWVVTTCSCVFVYSCVWGNMRCVCVCIWERLQLCVTNVDCLNVKWTEICAIVSSLKHLVGFWTKASLT